MEKGEFRVSQGTIFLELLSKQSQVVLKAAKTFCKLMDDYTDLGAKTADINSIEREGDLIAHELYVKLNRTLLSQSDREDVIELAAKCDDVLDSINGASKRLLMFDIEAPTEKMKQFAELILKAATQIDIMIANIKEADEKQADADWLFKEIDRLCEEVDVLENKGDELLHSSLVELFRRKDTSAVDIVKYKEIYEWLESALDRAEDTSYAIADLIMKKK